MTRKWKYLLIVEAVASAIILILYFTGVLSLFRLLVGAGILVCVAALVAIPRQDLYKPVLTNALTILGKSVAGVLGFFLLVYFCCEKTGSLHVYLIVIFAAIYWAYSFWDYLRERKQLKKLQAADIKIVYVETLSQLKMLYDNAALTWEEISEEEYGLAMASFCDDGINGEAYITTGKVMNDLCHLTGSNAYPDDLKILSILNCSKRYDSSGNSYGARWMDDIVDNNARQEGWKPF